MANSSASAVVRGLRIPVILGLFVLLCTLAGAQQASSHEDDKTFDVQSSVGDAHVGNDADASLIGLPEYPGSRRMENKPRSSNANVSISTSAFGFKLVVVKYYSSDSPDKVTAFYRDKLKKYGKVLECHSKDVDDVQVNDDDNSKSGGSKSNELHCEGDNTGNVVQLKVGREDSQHDVGIEAQGTGTSFALVLLKIRGKDTI
jgi:hypothetical protein